MKKLINVLIFAFLTNMIYAQTVNKTISGVVKDTGNEVLPGSTIRLLKASDSTMVKGEITDGNGKFQFSNLENSTYLLDITSMGQKRFVSVPLTISDVQSTISLPVIILLPAKTVELKELTVKAKKPLIEQEIDKTIVNVESMISSATSNTMEVLEKTPGISVNNNGEISLNGKSGVMVLIDGRSTYMSGQDLAAYLKSLPGGLLDKIELIDNPSARYDAAGNAVINIRLKKNKIGGLTGSVSTGITQGKYARNNDALNLNYNRKKVNVFANLGYNYEKNYALDIYNRRFYNASSELVSRVDLVNDQVYKNKSINVNFGLDFAATPKTTYGVIFNLNKTNRNGVFEYDSKNYDSSNSLELIGSGSTIGGDKRTNTGINLNMLHKLNNYGRELSVDVNYLHYLSKGHQTLRNLSFEPNGALISRSDFIYLIPSDINIYTAKADYVHPFKNKGKLETGFKSSVINNDNVFDYYKITDGFQVIDNANSNHFKYKENINAVYINGQKSWRRFGAQLGLRVENTHINGNQLGNEEVEGSEFTKNYTGLFPSAFVSYKLDDKGKNTFVLMAVRRISRPNYQLLNPFLFQRDQYTYSSGNPDINPQYQNRLELKYQHKQVLNMGLSYNKFTNSIFPTTKTIDSIFINRPDNIKGGYMVLLNTTVNTSVTKWWYTNTTLRLSRIGLRGIVYGEQLRFDTNMARLELNNYFTLSKTVSAEFGGYYASRDFSGQAVTSGMYILNASIQKKIWDGKGSIRLSANDLFHSWVYHNKSISLIQSDYLQTNKTDTQRIGVAFTYRFGKDTFARKRKHNDNASDDEKGRL
ncbi:outer membrane beta-barrel protein [Dyadobacter sp. NIV53]|uniref:outer membrane beta-barrel protein n=1 Tax=Dyadobacter sp. NIV53 TaxID=2861765 RepID=UPI001C876200|nr:outer membrane beta-barrel protein [Dyadobacter sp. NIV53]